jgi:iron complex transport system substrate-binding protein
MRDSFMKNIFAFARPLSALTMGCLILFAPVVLAQDKAVPVDSSKIVTIGGAVTEIVYALGEENRIIGRDSTSVFPPEALQKPDIGYMRALSAEGVLALGPTAILAIDGSGPVEAIDVLKKAGTPFVQIPDVFTADGIVAKINAVGKALQVEDKAEALAKSVGSDLKAASDAALAAGTGKRVVFILSYRDGKIMASGKATAADGIIQLAGGVNAITEYSGYKAVSPEALIKAAPDVILMMDNGGDHSATNVALLADSAIKLTPAGRDQALVRMDGAYLLGFGPRTASAVRDLSALLGQPTKVH